MYSQALRQIPIQNIWQLWRYFSLHRTLSVCAMDLRGVRRGIYFAIDRRNRSARWMRSRSETCRICIATAQRASRELLLRIALSIRTARWKRAIYSVDEEKRKREEVRASGGEIGRHSAVLEPVFGRVCACPLACVHMHAYIGYTCVRSRVHVLSRI